jgi:hypothetical protein
LILKPLYHMHQIIIQSITVLIGQLLLNYNKYLKDVLGCYNNSSVLQFELAVRSRPFSTTFPTSCSISTRPD